MLEEENTGLVAGDNLDYTAEAAVQPNCNFPGEGRCNLPTEGGCNLPLEAGCNLPVDSGCNLPLVAGCNLPLDAGCNLPLVAGCNLPLDAGCNLPLVAGCYLSLVLAGWSWPCGWSTHSLVETWRRSHGNDSGSTDNMHNNSKPRWK